MDGVSPAVRLRPPDRYQNYRVDSESRGLKLKLSGLP